MSPYAVRTVVDLAAVVLLVAGLVLAPWPVWAKLLLAGGALLIAVTAADMRGRRELDS